MNKAGKISAIVVNYNGIIFIEGCLKSLLKEQNICEIIVVDNGSVDGSLDYLRQNFSEIILVPTNENLGFSRACNLGALRARGEFLLLLNYDAEFHSGLDEALSHFTEHPRVGLVGGKLVYPEGRPQPSVGRSFVPLRLIFSWTGLSRVFPLSTWLSREILDNNWYLYPHESIEWTTGALMLIRHSDWEKVGGMDPAYFLYVEDVDLCERLKASGSRLDYLPELSAMHLKGGGGNIISLRALLSTVDSYNIYLSKYFNQFLTRTTLASIGIVFLFRTFVLMFRLWRGKQALHEAQTYLRGAQRAFSLSAGRRFAWGPPV